MQVEDNQLTNVFWTYFTWSLASLFFKMQYTSLHCFQVIEQSGENLPQFPWSRSSLNLSSLRGCIPDHDQKSNVADSTEFNALFFSSLHAAICRIMTHLGEKWLRKVGSTCAKGRGISCSPTPRLCSVVCGVVCGGGIGRRRQQPRRRPYARPTPPPPGSPQLQSNAHQGQDEDVNTRSLYRAQNFEDSPTKNAAALLPCRCTVIYLVLYCPKN